MGDIEYSTPYAYYSAQRGEFVFAHRQPAGASHELAFVVIVPPRPSRLFSPDFGVESRSDSLTMTAAGSEREFQFESALNDATIRETLRLGDEVFDLEQGRLVIWIDEGWQQFACTLAPGEIVVDPTRASRFVRYSVQQLKRDYPGIGQEWGPQ